MESEQKHVGLTGFSSSSGGLGARSIVLSDWKTKKSASDQVPTRDPGCARHKVSTVRPKTPRPLRPTVSLVAVCG